VAVKLNTHDAKLSIDFSNDIKFLLTFLIFYF